MPTLRHQALVPALRAPQPREPLGQQPTFQAPANCLFDEARVAAALKVAGLIQECLEMFPNNPVQHRLYGLVVPIRLPTGGTPGSGTEAAPGDRW
jgi:hypothetical protein